MTSFGAILPAGNAPTAHGAPAAYPLGSRLAHWAGAMVMLLAFALVWLREDLPKGDLRAAMLVWHQWAGLLVLASLAPRLLARWWARAPTLADMPRWQRFLARATETGLYIMMIAQPLLGWLMLGLKGREATLFGVVLPALANPDQALAGQVKDWHEAGGTVILVLVGLHVLGALYHHFWRRDGVLAAMLGSRAPADAAITAGAAACSRHSAAGPDTPPPAGGR